MSKADLRSIMPRVELADEEGSSEIHTFVVLYEAAERQVECLEPRRPGWLYHTISAFILAAFTLEAYLNHLGPEVLASWSSLERSSPKEKLNALASALKIRPDFGRRPFSSFTAAFRVRNRAAHGRTERVTYKRRVRAEDHSPYHAKSYFEKRCGIPQTRRVFEDTRIMVERLHRAARQPGDPFSVRVNTQVSRHFLA